MRKTILVTIFLLIVSNMFPILEIESPDIKLKEKTSEWISEQQVLFLENKGQIVNTNDIPVPFVLFKVSGNKDMNVYVTEKGLTYVFVKTTEERKGNEGVEHDEKENDESKQIEMAWINMCLKGANISNENIIKEGESGEHYNYFYSHCPDGIYNVKQYEKITIKDIYKGIDWRLYNSSKSGLKYDFIVHPGADPSQIKLLYEGQNIPMLDNNGNLVIKTKFGTLTEQAPYSYLQETGAKIKSSFKRTVLGKNDAEVVFNLESHNRSSTLIIDPQLVWGTLYGGSVADGIMGLTVDKSNNIFAGGYTSSSNFPVQTQGAFYQGVFAGPGTGEAFILKFNNAGSLLWATYYGGGSETEVIYSLAVDANNNLFASGFTRSTNFPVQNSGTFFQGTNAGGGGGMGGDAFILKFNNAGVRLWATYYGGTGTDAINAIAIDANNNLFVAGFTTSTNFPVQNTGTFFQGINAGNEDAFILKFDNLGNRLWATYYGGLNNDKIYSLAIDGNNNLFAGGFARSNNFPVQTSGTFFQGVNNGSWDGTILKFDNIGNRLWATYYGGSSTDMVCSLAIDNSNNVFAGGYTRSINFPVQSNGTFFQGLNAGGDDGFILKFDNLGNRLWATYYGGSGNENMVGVGDGPDDLVIDGCGNVYLGLNTRSPNMPLVSQVCDFFDGAYGAGNGGEDGFISKFSNSGNLLWSSYVGSALGDSRVALVVDNADNLFMAGEFMGYTSGVDLPLVNPGGGAYFDDTPNGSDDSYILKFTSLLTYSQSQINSTACTPCNGSATMNLTCGDPNYSYVWSNGSSSINVTGNTNTVSGLCPGTYTVTVTSNCNNTQTTAYTITGTNCTCTLAAQYIKGTANCASCLSAGAGGCKEWIMLTGSGGTTPYNYLWPSGYDKRYQNKLCPGNYTVKVTDINGCSVNVNLSVP